MHTRVAIRTAFIVIVTAIAMLINGGDIVLPWHPLSTYGISVDQRGSVTAADTVAQRSGLHPGARIRVERLQPMQRLRLAYTLPLAPEGSTIRVSLASGQTVTLTSHPRLRSMADNVTNIIKVMTLWAYIVVAALLALLRPRPSMWAFYTFSFAFCAVGVLTKEYMPDAAFLG